MFRLFCSFASCLYFTSCAASDELSVVGDISLFSFTSCVLRDRAAQQLPGHLLNATNHSSHFNPAELYDKDGNKYFVLLWSNVIGEVAGRKVKEICHAVMGRPRDGVYFGAFQPEVEYIQDGRCFANDRIPGHVQIAMDVERHNDEIVASVDGVKIFEQVSKPHVPGKKKFGLESWGPGGGYEFPVEAHGKFKSYHTHGTNNGEHPDGVVFAIRTKETSYVVEPVSVAIPNLDKHNQLYGANVDSVDIHSCMTFYNTDFMKDATIKGWYRPIANFYESVKGSNSDVRSALGVDASESGFQNLEEAIMEAMRPMVDEPALLEPYWAKGYRHFQAICGLSYPFFALLQKWVMGTHPPKRFDSHYWRVRVHAMAGSFCLFIGIGLHVANEIQRPFYRSEEVGGYAEQTWRLPVYYALAVFGLIQSLTVFSLLEKCMGERRITIPIYFGAGAVNLTNTIVLLMRPSLESAFKLWGSISIFIYVRYGIISLSFAPIDWDLLYTYSLPLSALIGYPLSLQDEISVVIVMLPVFYSPFHSKICRLMGWSEEGDSNNDPRGKDTIMFNLYQKGIWGKDVENQASVNQTVSKKFTLKGTTRSVLTNASNGLALIAQAVKANVQNFDGEHRSRAASRASRCKVNTTMSHAQTRKSDNDSVEVVHEATIVAGCPVQTQTSLADAHCREVHKATIVADCSVQTQASFSEI